MKIENVIFLIKKLGFTRINGSADIWEKKYPNHDNYEIMVDFDNKAIRYEYPDINNSLIVNSYTTSNFSDPENFVVLECVNRLLEKGYKPHDIELEHSWASGGGTSGRLDILVRKLGNPYLMIECKTYGKEYQKEKLDTLSLKKVGNEEQPKGQLFQYYFEEKTTKYLCLYTSKCNNKNIEYENSIIVVDDGWRNLSNKKEVFDYWNKTFRHNGIFDEGAIPYDIECKALLRKNLQKLTDKDSTRIFNQFLEILRHNAVSDKPNAFNKILNLFICKIIDEDRNDNDELKFQWKDNTTYVSLQSNLEDLYKIGMNRFLNISVTDYSEKDIEDKLSVFDLQSRLEIKRMFQELRLQKNPEFAFKEVYNSESFEENAKVIKEIVQLLQDYQFRYGHKQQFLGNFFELLLNTSIKQESGQFFTPVPIARFMISSLPIEDIIKNKIYNDSRFILPIMVDYACGSGHFISEYMDVLQDIINEYDTTNIRRSAENQLNRWKQNHGNSYQSEFEWASQCVYGIEKDYRLVKTTKISTFLNGDGNANVIHADGLDKFHNEKYINDLKSNSKCNKKFDLVIANPPYSVSSFKQTLPSDSSDFELFDYLTENSSEIECMFVERTYQLLSDNGCAAIILPSSILSNTSFLYEKTREIILNRFNLIAIAKMGSNTFMATGTNTIILFLNIRPTSSQDASRNLTNTYMSNHLDFSYNGVESVVSNYLLSRFDEEVSLDEYGLWISNIEAFQKSPLHKELNSSFEKLGVYKNLIKKNEYKKASIEKRKSMYDKLFFDFMIENEKKKLYFYTLTCGDKTIIVNTGEKEAEKEFLGYEFSNRRGQEGIHYFTDDQGNISSSLYDENNLENSEKVNFYINQAFKGNYPHIVDKLLTNMKVVSSSSLLKYENSPFDLSISLTSNYKVLIASKYKKVSLKELCVIRKGQTITAKEAVFGDIPVVAGGKDPAYYHNLSNREPNHITISASGAYAGYVSFWDNPIFASDCTTIKSNDEGVLLTKYIYIVLKQYQEDIYRLQKGQGQPHVYPDDLGKINFPVPPVNIQKSIVNEYDRLLEQNEKKIEKVSMLRRDIEEISNHLFLENHTMKKMSEISRISRGASPRPIKKFLTKSLDGINWIKISDVKPGEKYIFSSKQKITLEGANKSVSVKIGDFIISNSMSFGRPYIMKTDGCIHDGWLLISDIDPNVSQDYLYYILSCEAAQNQFKERASSGSSVDNLNIDRVKQVKIPILNSAQQTKLIETIVSRENKISEIEEDILQTKLLIDHLISSN